MRVIIAGSRAITDIYYVRQAIYHSGFLITEVICGCAKGVDSLGRDWAKDNGIGVREVPAIWRGRDGVYNPKAGFERNRRMAGYADALIAVWDGESGGTKNMIDEARKRGIQIFAFINPLAVYF